MCADRSAIRPQLDSSGAFYASRFKAALCAHAALLVCAAPPLTTLQPSAFRVIQQNLPVNIVFVGYEPGARVRDVDTAAFLSGLAAKQRTRVRIPHSQYGIAKDLGVAFDYQYNIVYANAAFENAFFGYLNSIAVAQPVNYFQGLYNSQLKRSHTVTNNAVISARHVERWLADNTQTMIGVDTHQYTVFFVNWYGRPDFRHHGYVAASTDPDTGFPWGGLQANQMLSFGGAAHNDGQTPFGDRHRIWFHDLSAGPDWGTGNWNVDDPRFSLDGSLDYRMPPVWEYGNLSAYRPFNDLTGDLSKIMRYVAMNLMFTPHPLYDPSISAPKLPKNFQLDINVHNIDPASTFSFIPQLVVNGLKALQPVHSFTTETKPAGFPDPLAKAWQCFFTTYLTGTPCFPNKPLWSDTVTYYNNHLNQYLEGEPDYEIPVFVLHGSSAQVPFTLGIAHDNFRDGTQSQVRVQSEPVLRQFYDYTLLLIHETGHHLGLSHTHDGYDSTTGTHYGPFGPYYFSWTGDAVSSAMSYQGVEILDFSQFDQDNMNRWLTSVYVNEANRILSSITASPRASQVDAEIAAADSDATAALSSYAAFQYHAASDRARRAYDRVLSAAGKINIKIEPQAAQADYKSHGKNPKFGGAHDDYSSAQRRAGQMRR